MGSTPKGVATRHRILDAAWELSDERGVEVVLGGVTLREIAARVDMSPSAVAYHFPTMGQLAVAMVERLAETVSLVPIEAVDDLLAQAGRDGLVAVIRLAAQTNWQLLCEPDEVVFERRLARCYAATGRGEHAAVVKDLIGTMTASWITSLSQVYRRTAEAMGLRAIEPFDFDELARGAAALSEGLLYQWMWEPGAVRSDLAADLLVAMVSTLMAPAPHAVTLAERTADLPGPRVRPGAGVGAWADDIEVARDLALAVAAAPLFRCGVRELTSTEVGRALDVGPEVVRDRYGSVERLAALSFGRHLPNVVEATGRRTIAGPSVSLTDGVYELTRSAQNDPHCALALLHERQRATLDPTCDPQRGDIHELVPFGAALVPPLCELIDRPAAEVADLADLIVDTTVGHAATRPRQPIERITATVLRLVPAEF